MVGGWSSTRFPGRARRRRPLERELEVEVGQPRGGRGGSSHHRLPLARPSQKPNNPATGRARRGEACIVSVVAMPNAQHIRGVIMNEHMLSTCGDVRCTWWAQLRGGITPHPSPPRTRLHAPAAAITVAHNPHGRGHVTITNAFPVTFLKRRTIRADFVVPGFNV